jgi:hypothetical protein
MGHAIFHWELLLTHLNWCHAGTVVSTAKRNLARRAASIIPHGFWPAQWLAGLSRGNLNFTPNYANELCS